MPPVTHAILLDVPEQFETERLILRMPRPDDVAEITQRVQESLDWLRPWMDWAHYDFDETIARLVGAHQVADYMKREIFHLRIIEKSSRRIIGACSIFNIDWSVPRVEIGYWLHPDFAGRGYASESVHKMTEVSFGLLHAERVEIRCDAKNVRSAAVAERCGFKKEGLLRNHDQNADRTGLRDTLVFSKIRPEWTG